MAWLAVFVFCSLGLRGASNNVETRIHQIIRPQASSGIQFGVSLESDNTRQKLFIGAPKKQNGGIYKCSYNFVSSVNECSESFTYGSANSSAGSSMARVQSKAPERDFLVVCGNQYSFSCAHLEIQQRMIGECYSHDLNTDEIAPVTSPCPLECPQGLVADLMFLLDASGSVRQLNFDTGLNWVNTVLNTFRKDINSGNVQVGYVVFSSESYMEEPPASRSFDDVATMISSIPYYGGGTSTDKAIDSARLILKDSRKGLAKVMIIITDGQSNFPPLTTTAAQTARSDDIVMISVGVGNEIEEPELRRIATGDESDPTRVMTVSSYDNLDEILDELSQTIKETASTGLEGAESNSTTELTNCQFGSSVAASSNALYIGAMGSYDRTGTVAEFSDLTGFPSTPSSGHLNDTELVTMMSTTAKKIKDAYFGYSVATGKFKVDGKTWIAMGAPRYFSRGSVVLYESGSTDEYTVLHPTNGSSNWQLGGGFGHAVLVMDINGDTYDDLVVAAPLHSQIAGYDEGLVFVYMNDKSSTAVATWKTPEYTPLLLQGNRAVGSRFGMAIANGGDIDGNGYNDVIIGAPGEKKLETDFESGVIYIYFSSEKGLDPKNVQRIEGISVTRNTKLSGFGYALHGGTDFDTNGYPDIAVSAPANDTVVLLRSRKLISVTAEISVHPSVIDIVRCAKNSSIPCSTVTSCVSAQYQKDPDGETFEIVQHITLDSSNRESLHKRLKFMDSDSDVLSFTDSNVGTRRCRQHQIQLNADAMGRTNGGEIEVTPSVKIFADLSPNHKLQNMSGVLSGLSQNQQTAQMSFATGCNGVEGRCDHDLVLAATYSHLMSSSPIILTGENQIFTVNCIVENKGPDNAYFLKMNVSSGNLAFHRVGGDSCMQVSDTESNSVGGTTVLKYYSGAASLQDLMPSGAKCEFSIEFQFIKMEMYANESQVRVTGKVYSNAGGDEVAFDKNTENNDFAYFKAVHYQSNVIVSASSVPGTIFFYPPKNQSVKTVQSLEDDILGGNSTKFVHEYSLRNYGPLGMAAARISIRWPEHTVHGHMLLYLIDVGCQPPAACTCHKEGKANKLAIAPNKVSATSAFQQVNISYPQTTQAIVSSDKLTCENSKCDEIFCDISYIETFSAMTLFASFKLWAPTFGQEFTKAEVYTMFKLIPSDATLLPSKTDASAACSVTSYDPSNPPPAPPTNEIDIGVIIGAILGSLVFLAIVIVVMWKAGFFNSKYEQMTREARENADQQNADYGGETFSSSDNLYDN